MESWLAYNGIEIANGPRVAAYVAAGLGPPGLQMDVGCSCDELIPVGGYHNPVTDDAPWWDPLKPESDSFLGFMPLTINVVPKVSRTVTGAGINGVSLSRLGLGGAVIQVSGYLVSASAAGMEYGERWLISALRNQCVAEGCDVGTVCVLPSCPEGVGYSPSSFRTLYRAGLVDYTPAAPVGDVPSWYVRQVSFQIQSELPYLYEDPVPLAVALPLGYGPVVGSAVTGQWPGEAGVRIKIAAGQPNALGPVRVTGAPHRAGAGCAGTYSGAAAYYNVDRQFTSPYNVSLALDPQLQGGSFPDQVVAEDAYHSIVDLTGHGWTLFGWGSPNGNAYRPVLKYDGIKYLWIPDGNSLLSAPDTVGLSVTGNLALEVDVEVPSWGYGTTGFYDFVGKEATASTFSFLFRWNRTLARLELIHSTNGTALVTGSVPWAPEDLGYLNDLRVPPRYRFRSELNVANGVKTFYVSTDGVTYALIGSTPAGAATSVFDSTSSVVFVGRFAGPSVGYFRGKFYKGFVGSGLWSTATTVAKGDPNIDTDGVHTSSSMSDGVNTWTIVRPGSGAKAALVWRGMAIIGPDSQQEGYYLSWQLKPGALQLLPHVGQVAAGDSFTVMVYGKAWGSSTGQTLASDRLAGGGGWELRRGAVANTIQAVLVDNAGHTVTASAAGAFTAGTPFVAVLRRDVAADTLTALLGIQAGAPVTDTTTTAPDGGDNVPFVIGATKDVAFTSAGGSFAGGLSQADFEFYGAAVFYRALTNAELTVEINNMAVVSAPNVGQPSTCFDTTATLPAGTELTIDGATHSVELRRQSDGVLIGGLDVLTLSGPMTWPEMGPCTEVCWTVDAAVAGGLHNTDSKVTIEQFNREV